MGLTERIDAVCKARGWSDRAWSLKAGRRGTMDTTAPTPSAEPRPDARAMFVQQLARSIADLAAAGDDDAARKASQLLTELLTDETPAQAPPRARSA